MSGFSVCFISKEMPPFYYGGIGIQFQLLMRFLQGLGHKVYFVTRRPEGLSCGWRETSYDGIDVHFASSAETKLNGHVALEYSFLVADAVHRLARTTTIDLIVAPEFEAESFGLLVNPPRRQDGQPIPIIITLNGPSVEILHSNGRAASPYDRVICAMENAVISSAGVLISPSSQLWSELSGRLHLEPRAHWIIPNFCDRSVFNSRGGILTPSTERIVYVGRLQRVKGVDLLLEAFISVAAKLSDCELVIIGRDLLWPEYQMTFTKYWCERLPRTLLDRIRFVGSTSQENVAKELGQASVAVFPSRWEAFGIAALESLSMGVPVIISQGTGLAEVVGSGYPLMVDVSQGAESLSAQIIGFFEDKGLRSRLAQEAINRAEEMYRVATEQWRLVVSQELLGHVDTTSHSTGLEPVFAALNTYIGERGSLLDVRSRESEERDRIIAQQHDDIQRRDQTVAKLTAELLARDQLIVARDERATNANKVILAKDRLVEQQQAELRDLTTEVATRDALIQAKDHSIEHMTGEIAARTRDLEESLQRLLRAESEITRQGKLLEETSSELVGKSAELSKVSFELTETSSELTNTKDAVRRLTEHWLVRAATRLRLLN